MNRATFLADAQKYFTGAFEQFLAFGGPCVSFHRECLRAGGQGFLPKEQARFGRHDSSRQTANHD